MSPPYFSLIKNEVLYELQSLSTNLQVFKENNKQFTKTHANSLEHCQEIVNDDISFLKNETKESLDTWEKMTVFRHEDFARVEHYFSTIRLGCSEFDSSKKVFLFSDEQRASKVANLLAKRIWNCYENNEFPGLLVFGGEKYRTVPHFNLLTFPSVDERRLLYLGILGHEIGHMLILENHLRDEYYDEKYLNASSYLKHWEWELLADIVGITVLGPLLSYSFLVSGFPTLPILTIESEHGDHFCSNILWHPPDEIRLPLQIKVLEMLGITNLGKNSVVGWINKHVKNMNCFRPEALGEEFKKFKSKFQTIVNMYSAHISDLFREANTLVKDPYSAQKHEQAHYLAKSILEDSQNSYISADLDPIIVLNALCIVKICRADLDHKQISSKFIEYMLQS